MVGTRLSPPDGVCESTIRQTVLSLPKRIDFSGEMINPEWTELDKSRGLETHLMKVFMRFTVIISDYLLYVPALLAYTHYAIPAIRKTDKVFLPVISTNQLGRRIHTRPPSTFPPSRRSWPLSVHARYIKG